MTETEQGRVNIEQAPRLKIQTKKKKPKFLRQESWRYKRIKESWRRPQGLDNKMRRKIKGWPPTASVGYRGPKTTRGLHPSGYREVLAHNVKDVMDLDPETQVIRIAHAVSKRKRVKILDEARKRNIRILNFRELEDVVKEKEREEERLEEELEQEKKEAKPKKRKRQDKKKRVTETESDGDRDKR